MRLSRASYALPSGATRSTGSDQRQHCRQPGRPRPAPGCRPRRCPWLLTTSSLHSQPTVSAKDQPTARPTAVTTIHRPARATQRRRSSHSPSPPTLRQRAPVASPASASTAATSAVRPAATKPRAMTSVAQDQVTAPPATPPTAASTVQSAHTPSHCRQVRAPVSPYAEHGYACSSPSIPINYARSRRQGDEGNHLWPTVIHPAAMRRQSRRGDRWTTWIPLPARA